MKELNEVQINSINGGNWLLVLGAVAAGVTIAEAAYDYYKGATDGASDGFNENCYTCETEEGEG